MKKPPIPTPIKLSLVCLVFCFFLLVGFCTLWWPKHHLSKHKDFSTIRSSLAHAEKSWIERVEDSFPFWKDTHDAQRVAFSPLKRKQLLTQEKAWLKGISMMPPKKDFPAPLKELSAQEKKHFSTAQVIEYAQFAGPGPDQMIHLRLLKTDSQYPYIRTEEVVDGMSGHLIGERDMVANKLLLTLAEGHQQKEALHDLTSLGLSAQSVKPLSEEDGIYTISMNSHPKEPLLSYFTTVWDQYQHNHVGALPEPDKIFYSAAAEEGDLPIQTEPQERSAIDIGLPHQSKKELFPPNFFFSDQWYLWKEHPSFDGKAIYHGINAPEGWKVRTSAEDVVVAVIDSGIDYTHPNLRENIWENPHPTNGDLYGWSVDGDHNDPQADFYHGTMCAGIIGAAPHKGPSVAGVAWKVQLMGCKYSEGNVGSSEGVILACKYALANNAQIINMSLGGNFLTAILEPGEFRMMKRFRDAGVILVVAAGNESGNNDSFWMASYPGAYPLDNIMTVASLSMEDDLSWFSNYGRRSVDIAAPGERIFSTVLNHRYQAGFGTSFSAPLVTGAMALLKAEYPEASPKQLIDHLCKTSLKLPALSGKIRSGGTLDLGAALTTPLE